MPVNMRSHGHGQGYTDINFLIPEIIAQVTYQKGTYYGDVGDFSGAGSVGFSTQMTRRNGLASVTLGEDNYRRALVADSVNSGSRNATLYALEYQTYDGPWSDIDEDVDKLNGVLRHSIRLDDGVLTLGAMGYHNEWNSADQIPARAVESGLIDELGSIDPTLGGKTHRYSLNAIYTTADYALSAYAIDYGLSLFSNFTYYLDDPVNGDQFEQVDDRIADLIGHLVGMSFGHAFGGEEEAVAHGEPFSESDIKETLCRAAVSARAAERQWRVRAAAGQSRRAACCRSAQTGSAHAPSE